MLLFGIKISCCQPRTSTSFDFCSRDVFSLFYSSMVFLLKLMYFSQYQFVFQILLHFFLAKSNHDYCTVVYDCCLYVSLAIMTHLILFNLFCTSVVVVDCYGSYLFFIFVLSLIQLLFFLVSIVIQFVQIGAFTTLIFHIGFVSFPKILMFNKHVVCLWQLHDSLDFILDNSFIMKWK